MHTATQNLWRIVAMALCIGLIQTAVAQAQTSADPKPLLVIMLDTSGSMEFTAGNAVDASIELDMPECEKASATSPVDGKTYLKSRLITAQEVLTGTFEDYWCREDNRTKGYGGEMDQGYVLQHYDACTGTGSTSCTQPRQQDNGLLDLRFLDFKFALSTFHPYDAADVDFNNRFKVGPDRTGGLNLGIRNDAWGIPNVADVYDPGTNTFIDNSSQRSTENVGRLIMPPVDDAMLAQSENNLAVQREVLRLRGFSATPLGPMLEDVKHVLETHPNSRPPRDGIGDPFYECRPRIAVLITDGRSNPPDGSFGYSDTATALWALKNTEPMPVSVYVIGYNLESEDASVIKSLDSVNGGPADALLIADSPAELAAGLAKITSSELQGRRSRTTTVYTNATRSTQDLQYQFNAAYSSDPNYSINQVGYLNQTAYRCNASCTSVVTTGRSCAQGLYELHTRLNSRTKARNILFHVNGSLVDLTTKTPAQIATNLWRMRRYFGMQSSGNLPLVDPVSIGAGGIPTADPFATIGPVSSSKARREYMDQLVRYLRADSGTMRCSIASDPSVCQRMGAIRRTTPVVQEPQLPGKYPLESWNIYVKDRDKVSGYSATCRPTVLYAGTHDGMIHAFRVDNMDAPFGECAKQSVPSQSEKEVGEELWAIMPQELLKRSHSLVNNTAFLMDGSIVVDDVLMFRKDPENTDPEDEAENWRSVLIASYGRGGRGYIALDVTNPLKASTVDVLWEISSSEVCRGGTCYRPNAGSQYNFKRMGLSGAEPAFANVFIDGVETAVAILPGGANVSGEANSGRVVWVVRLSDGIKLAQFRNKGPNVYENGSSRGAMTYAMTGSPAAYPNLPGSVATRAFTGDAGGRMWRIDLVGPPSDWRMELVFDPYTGSNAVVAGGNAAREPVIGAPKLALTGDYGNVAVVYATGDIDSISGSQLTRGGVFSFSEVTAASGKTAIKSNWNRVLDQGESMTGEPEVFNKVAYWSTFARDGSSACLGGQGWVYGVDYVQNSGGSGYDNTVAKMDLDGDGTTIDFVKRKSTGSVVPFGVQVIERPSCFSAGGSISGSGLGSSGAQGISRGGVELVVNVAEGQFATPSTVPPGIDPKSLKTQVMTETLTDSGEAIQSAAWGYVLY